MKRGSVVHFQEKNSPASKSRPCVVVQRNSTLDASTKIIAVPLSSTTKRVPEARPLVVPTPQNGLKSYCEAEVDWVFSFRRERLGPVIGELDEGIMRQIDQALRFWLALS